MISRKIDLSKAFIVFATCIFGLTAMGKMIGVAFAFDDHVNPAFPILADSYVQLIGAVVEAIFATVLWGSFLSNRQKFVGVFWISMVFVGYRIATIGQVHRCKCLGPLPLSDRVYDMLSLTILGVLFFGSILALIYGSLDSKRVIPNSLSD